MAEVLEDRKYSKDHEWALVEGENIKVGITDYAQGELGDIVFLELPEVGASVTANESMGTIEAVKTIAEMFAPVTGTVTEVNQTAADDSAVVNRDSYNEGWLVKIKPDNMADVDTLLDADAYKKLIAE